MNEGIMVITTLRETINNMFETYDNVENYVRQKKYTRAFLEFGRATMLTDIVEATIKEWENEQGAIYPYPVEKMMRNCERKAQELLADVIITINNMDKGGEQN